MSEEYTAKVALSPEKLSKRHFDIKTTQIENQQFKTLSISAKQIVSRLVACYQHRLDNNDSEAGLIKAQIGAYGGKDEFKKSLVKCFYENQDSNFESEIKLEMKEQGFDKLLDNATCQEVKSNDKSKNISVQHGSRTARIANNMRFVTHELGYGPDNLAYIFVIREEVDYALLQAKAEFQRGSSLFALSKNREAAIEQVEQSPWNIMIDPYSCLHCRTCFMDDCVESFVKQYSRDSNYGHCAVVLLGGGFDGRLLRLNLPLENVSLYEIDAPGTQKIKLKKLDQVNIDHSRITYITCDFVQETWLEKLFSHGLDRSTPTLFVWEGVTMYLDQESILKTLSEISSMDAPAAVSFDYFTQRMVDFCRSYGEALKEPIVGGFESDVLVNDILKGKYDMKILDHASLYDLKDRYIPVYEGKTIAAATKQKCFIMAGNRNFVQLK